LRVAVKRPEAADDTYDDRSEDEDDSGKRPRTRDEAYAAAMIAETGAGFIAAGALVAKGATAAAVAGGGIWIVVGGGLVFVAVDQIEGGGLDMLDAAMDWLSDWLYGEEQNGH
jgi:hypothetical protein